MADTTTLKPSSAEDEFFAREDAEKKRRIAREAMKETADAERERLRALHHMGAPSVGSSSRRSPSGA